ncbi:alpha/beta hydrolase [Roseibacillus persicicus]|uniref:alpha/beta hydrolase n=1 Tax=Roseibacillus persicicus TaxID=454148 RepID=UPI00280CEA3F|nr:alpha/beta hydrolase [Roseibacillus persicicus]MDQ8189964.1 alpha/beta hydrolase [Roseibacillus persicicus]
MKIILVLAALLSPLMAFSYPPKLDTRSEVYRTVDDKELKVWIYGESDPANPKPAILFFFGGGWKSGSPEQFATQSQHFAERGMIAIVADYRVNSRNQVKAVECVKDAKACFAWVRENSERLGIQPDKICAAGGSAGGHLAAATGTLPGFGNEERPNAMILFNPGAVMADLGDWEMKGFGKGTDLGVPAMDLSPAHHVGPHTPPTLILHGEKDTTVPLGSAKAFEKAMKDAKRPVKLVTYEGQGHGFFNRGESYNATLKEADDFLVELGWLK